MHRVKYLSPWQPSKEDVVVILSLLLLRIQMRKPRPTSAGLGFTESLPHARRKGLEKLDLSKVRRESREEAGLETRSPGILDSCS